MNKYVAVCSSMYWYVPVCTCWYKIIGENYEEIIIMKELQIVKQEAIEHKDSLVKTQGNPKRKNTNNE